jgi:uncharacterized protein HemX
MMHMVLLGLQLAAVHLAVLTAANNQELGRVLLLLLVLVKGCCQSLWGQQQYLQCPTQHRHHQQQLSHSCSCCRCKGAV